MTPQELENIIRLVLGHFIIKYDDFKKTQYKVYKDRGIVGFIRFEKNIIYLDQEVYGKEEEITWAHEILSVYYYYVLGIIKHDDEIEAESRNICNDKNICTLIRRYIKKIRGCDQLFKRL